MAIAHTRTRQLSDGRMVVEQLQGKVWVQQGGEADTRPVVTGSRGSNAALASLLTVLQTAGLIHDDTT